MSELQSPEAGALINSYFNLMIYFNLQFTYILRCTESWGIITLYGILGHYYAAWNLGAILRCTAS
jgi:hypothetical protein